MDLSDVVIITNRLILKAIEECFVKDIFDEFTLNITTFMYPQPSGNIEDTWEFVRSSMEGLKEGTNLQLVILDKVTSEFLGCCGLHNLNEREPELGIWLKKSAHRNGYGLEAITGIIEWTRLNMDFVHLKYPVDKNNYASRRIPEFFNGKLVKEYTHTNIMGKELDIVEYWINIR